MDIRPARPDDKEAIVAFTTGTFEWGDYVPDAFDEWMSDPTHSIVLVAADEDDQPIGLVRVVMVSHEEAWLHGARVHPDARRRGIAMTATRAAGEWASQQGARVARLLTETWNTGAQAQVEKAGFRAVSQWFYAIRQIGSTQPDPTSNGGSRVPGPERLVPAPSAETEPAYLSWAGSELLRASRNLFPTGWTFRSLNLVDLEQASKERRLWQCPAGWVIGQLEDESFHVSWMNSNPDDAYSLARAMLDRATDLNAERLTALVPDTDFVADAFTRIGSELHRDILWELAL